MLGRLGLFSAERIARLTLGFFVGIAVARHLGPEAFGAVNYAMSIVAVFVVLLGLGTEGIVVRDIARDSAGAGKIIGAAFVVRGVTGVILYLLCTSYVWWCGAGEGQVLGMVALQAGVLFFGWADVIDFWFQADPRPYGAVVARIIVGIAGAALRLVLIHSSAGPTAFVVANLVESGLLAAALMSAWLLRGDRPTGIGFDVSEVWRQLREGWPLAISAVVVALTLQADRIAVGRLCGSEELGRYAASCRFFDVLLLFPLLVGMASQRLFSLAGVGGTLKDSVEAQRILRHTSFLLLLAGGAISLGSDWIIQFAYGTKYVGAGEILMVQAWAAVFVAHVSLRTRMLVAEGRTFAVLMLSVPTLVVQLVLLTVLVPRWGGQGAAFSTLATWLAGVLFVPFLLPYTRIYPLAFLSALGLPNRFVR